jgi:hypothetical protein
MNHPTTQRYITQAVGKALLKSYNKFIDQSTVTVTIVLEVTSGV